MLRALTHSPDTGWREVTELATISDLCDTSGTVVWAEANVSELTEADVSQITEEFGLHPLAVEDATRPRQRPKIEEYETHLFAVVHQLDEIDDQLEARQLACFVGRRWVLAIHDDARRTIVEAERRLQESPKELRRGSHFLMHALLDAIVDDYQTIADRLEEQVEALEEHVLADPTASVQRGLYALKQQDARFRRYVLPVSRILGAVVADHERFAQVTGEIATYFRDVYDHTLRVADQVRNVDDLANAILELLQMEQAAAQNEATKRLSAWAAIIAIPTFIASVYGMNFALVPREGHVEGFFFALGLMVATGVGLFAFFRRRRWL